ncbi:MAG: SDR family oxidoreductase [bacterium]|nr:SDR family oxidoreductase [bacterium]
MKEQPQKILVLGATGMLGHKLFTGLSKYDGLDVYATVRSSDHLDEWFSKELREKAFANVDADHFDSIIQVFGRVKPDVVINCIGIIKQLHASADPLVAIDLNALFPHKIANLCRVSGTRMIGISTDCVFDGKDGNYTEDSPSNASDLYGRTKFLGEVSEPHCLTLRTSIIGHELKGGYGLVEWFLAREDSIKGFKKVFYSGFPTIELVDIIRRYILPNPQLQGVYQVSSAPVSKYDLLTMVARYYKKEINILPVDEPKIDRTLVSNRFRQATGYQSPDWDTLVKKMADDYFSSTIYKNRRGIAK